MRRRFRAKESDDINEIMPFVQPEDLIKFGLIPEFIGRLPIMATLDDLSLDALVQDPDGTEKCPGETVQEAL